MHMFDMLMAERLLLVRHLAPFGSTVVMPFDSADVNNSRSSIDEVVSETPAVNSPRSTEDKSNSSTDKIIHPLLCQMILLPSHQILSLGKLLLQQVMIHHTNVRLIRDVLQTGTTGSFVS